MKTIIAEVFILQICSVGVNFINILCANYFYESALSSFSFSFLQFGFVIFWLKNMSTKGARKLLMKLTLGILSLDQWFSMYETRRPTILDEKIFSAYQA
jgi:hypothetical protein